MTKTNEYLKIAQKYGFILVRRNKHYILKHPSGAVVSCPVSPSDSKHGVKNFKNGLVKMLQAKPVQYNAPKR